MTSTRWATYPTAEHLVTAANFRAAFYRHGATLTRNHLFRGWIGAVPIFWGKTVTGGTLAKDTSASDYRGGVAAKWTQAAVDPVNELIQDVGGIVGPAFSGSEEDWQGLQVIVRVKTAAGSFARAYAKVGVSTWTSSYHTGGGGWEDLVVMVPASALAAIDDSIYVGAQFATVGAPTIAYVDEVLAVPGGFTPSGLILPDARLVSEVGVVDATNARRSESDLAMLAYTNDGTIEAGGATVLHAPSLAAVVGAAAPGIVAAFFNPRSTGTNAWASAALSKIATVDIQSGGIQIKAFTATTFGTAGTLMRSDLLLFLEPTASAVLTP